MKKFFIHFLSIIMYMIGITAVMFLHAALTYPILWIILIILAQFIVIPAYNWYLDYFTNLFKD